MVKNQCFPLARWRERHALFLLVQQKREKRGQGTQRFFA